MNYPNLSSLAFIKGNKLLGLRVLFNLMLDFFFEGGGDFFFTIEKVIVQTFFNMWEVWEVFSISHWPRNWNLQGDNGWPTLAVWGGTPHLACPRSLIPQAPLHSHHFLIFCFFFPFLSFVLFSFRPQP